MSDSKKFATDIFGNRFYIGSKVLFAHASKLYEAIVSDIEWSDGNVVLTRTSGTGVKLPKEPSRQGEQLVVIDERHARPNE